MTHLLTLSKKDKIILLMTILGFTVLGFKYVSHLMTSGTFDLATNLAIGGLGFSLWQTLITLEGNRETKFCKEVEEINTNIAAIKSVLSLDMQRTEQRLATEISDIKNNSRNNDFYQSQQINTLTGNFATIQAQVEFHISQFGHKGQMEEILSIKSDVSRLRADASAADRMGEFYYRLERLEKSKGITTMPQSLIYKINTRLYK